MKKILIVAKYTLKENISNKIFNGVLFFGGILLLGTQLLNEIALYEGDRVVRDTGLFLIEMFIMLITIYISSTHIIKAQKEKSIYLILTKPISKSEYIYGSVLGIIYTVGFNIGVMGIFLGIVLGDITLKYVILLLYIFIKLAILSGIGIMFSVVSESFVMAIMFTLSTYIMGHALLDLKAIAEKISGTISSYIINVLYLILPKYHLLNYKDYLANSEINVTLTLSYALVYLLVVTSFSCLIFKRKRL